MRENRRIAVLFFTDAYEKQGFYREMEREGWDVSCISCRGMEGTNCYCDEAAAEEIRERIRPFGAGGLHFLDSGNYHYVSRLWLELVTEPFDLLVFDHHTDMQEPAFGGILSCGGWGQGSSGGAPSASQGIPGRPSRQQSGGCRGNGWI